MEQYTGQSACGGIAIGTIKWHCREKKRVTRRRITDVDRELKRYEAAVSQAVWELTQLKAKAAGQAGESSAAVFEAHRLMLEDEDYREAVTHRIQTQQVNAEYAIATACDTFVELFSSLEDAYLRERAADIQDISERLLSVLSEEERHKPTGKSQEPQILLAEDLAPSETIQLDKEQILAIVTRRGTTNSHTAILARAMGIPALVGVKLPAPEQLDGRQAVVDGFSGTLFLEPEEELRKELEQKQKEQQRQQELLRNLKGKETVTADGKRIRLYANIGDKRELAEVLRQDAEGIGLFRSEFLYLDRPELPGEEEQFQTYRLVVETMAGKPVIIRTLDIGADKPCEALALEREENPALGMRAVRICLTRPELLRTQLRALYRASVYGNLSMMIPMITSLWEVRKVKELAEQVKEELQADGIPVCEVPIGIMIETPAAALISDLLAKEVSFFSIGTNDLTQYLLAMDRQNTELEPFFDPHHPALLRLLSMVTENAHRAGIWVGICGELGGDETLTEQFVRMGIGELSVVPSRILPLRSRIRQIRAEITEPGEA